MPPMVGGEPAANASAEQLIEVSKLGLGATSERFTQIAMGQGYTVVAVGPNRFRVARVYRPTWAVVAAVPTVALCGIGLLFLLVKNTETGDATITEDRTGVKVRLTGTLRSQFLTDLRSAMWSSEHPAPDVGPGAVAQRSGFAPAAPTGTPSPMTERGGTPLVDAATVPRKSRPANRIAELSLVLADGRSIAVAEGGVIGRDPSADPSMPWAALHAIPDPSLSKTHLSVGPLPKGVWILDHHSTNGTSVVSNGVKTPCTPGMRAEAPIGAQVIAGDLRMEVGSL